MSNSSTRRGAIRVLIVDDSRTIRALIRLMLTRAPDIEVVGEAADPFEAREMIRALEPDVITLDVEMPRMDGLDFLDRLMRLRPMPVVMVSGRTTANSHDAVRALALGAVECIDVARLLDGGPDGTVLADILRIAAGSRPQRHGWKRASRRPDVALPFTWNGKLVLVGASTGGVDALMTLLADFPENGPPAVIAQHMPAPFLASFTERLARHCRISVIPAVDGLRLTPGLVAVSQGGKRHVALSRHDRLSIATPAAAAGDTLVPSIDRLFASAEPHAQGVIGVLLTGMGRDGSETLLQLHRAGAHTIVQDADSAVVDGMPGRARALGAASEVAALGDIASRILASSSRPVEASL